MDFGNLLIYVLAYFGLFTTFYFLITLFLNRFKINDEKLLQFPKVTIVIPVYNGAKVLSGTADSLLELDYPKEKLDLIIVDDGSSDETPIIAKTYKKKGFRVFIRKSNQGKGEALNFAIKYAKGDFFGALDADSFAAPDSLRRLMSYFKNKNVMAVTPSLRIFRPKSILQRIQQIEYLIGILLRKIFSMLGSIHVTPGPLSIYRMSFFKKYGGYDTNNLTEDIELALRIQKHNFIIENSVAANVYTKGPKNFRSLLRQRLRWYKGFLDNVISNRELFSIKHGNLGLFILPASFISIGLVVISIIYTLFKIVDNLINKFIIFQAINFDIFSLKFFDFDWFFLNFNAPMILSLILVFFGIITLLLAKSISKDKTKIKFSYILYVLFYWFLFGYWWSMSSIYKMFNKKIIWGGKAL